MYGEVNPKAQLSVGLCYAKGEGVEKDLKKAAEWISLVDRKKVSEADKVWKQYELEKYYASSPELAVLKEKVSTDDMDAQQAFEWHLKAAKKGGEHHYDFVISSYYRGNGVKRNSKKVFEWNLKQSIIPEGYPQPFCAIGDAYLKGEGVEKDPKKAFKWYTSSSYISGKDDDAQASVYAEISYILARRVEKDPKKAFEWYLKVADLDRYGQFAHNQYDIGVSYANGYGTEQDVEKALKWFLKAAEQGLKKAQFNVGVLYKEGEGVEKDLAEAFKWHFKAAKQGYAKAQYAVAVSYAHGEGVEKNLKKAADWISQIDKKKVPEAAELWEEFDLKSFCN